MNAIPATEEISKLTVEEEANSPLMFLLGTSSAIFLSHLVSHLTRESDLDIRPSFQIITGRLMAKRSIQ